MAKDDGGPAFPLAVDCAPGTRVEHQVGMSLRAYFAGQALMGWTASGALGKIAENNGCDFDRARNALAEGCYLLADAMLAARDQP